jgi:hypothetical protein
VQPAPGLRVGALEELLALVVGQAEQMRLGHRGPSIR